jgi:hypothetical protein
LTFFPYPASPGLPGQAAEHKKIILGALNPQKKQVNPVLKSRSLREDGHRRASRAEGGSEAHQSPIDAGFVRIESTAKSDEIPTGIPVDAASA